MKPDFRSEQTSDFPLYFFHDEGADTMANPLSTAAQEQLFTAARSHNGWLDQPVEPAKLRELYDLLKFGPTAANACPARLIFVTTTAAKEKLKPTLMAGNVEKTMTAPVTVIVAQDMEFYEQLPFLFPHTDARSWYAGKPEAIREAAFRNSTLQGGYLITAARALGLDCGPMSGFDADQVKAAFFPDKPWQANFLCNLGYGDPAKLFPRSPRLAFEQACEVV